MTTMMDDGYEDDDDNYDGYMMMMLPNRVMTVMCSHDFQPFTRKTRMHWYFYDCLIFTPYTL